VAARVRVEAQRIGHDISPDHVSVRRWLNGGQPHDDTVRCIAAVLSAKLGRKITFEDIGFTAPEQADEVDIVDDGAHYSPKPEQAVNLLADLTSADLSDSPIVTASGWVSETAPSVITGYLFAEPLRLDQPGPTGDSGADVAGRIR